jgi:hypothetical protein
MDTSSLPEESKAAKKSCTYAVCGTTGYYEVPSYYARRGHSVDEAAKSLGLRVLGRRENGLRDDIAAEIHESGSPGTFLCVKAV